MTVGSHVTPIQSVAIILAAGSSSRMGQSKQLLNIEGESMLRRTIRTILDSDIRQIVVVLGANQDVHQKEISDLPILTVTNPNWNKGMGNSLKTGVQFAINKFPTLDTLLIAVCDQPLLTADHLKKLIKNHFTVENPIVASFYSGSPGVPALFHRSLVKRLLELDDAHGAKRIAQEYPELTSLVEFPEGAIDLDTPEDWKKFNEA